jgi:four helix bundle protein
MKGNFEEIIIWQKSKQLAIHIYSTFGSCRDFGFRDQIQRAAVSVMNNIAEGYERYSKADFARFLLIAKGSVGEVRSMLILGREIGYISEQKYSELSDLCVEISKMLTSFRKTLIK